MLLSSSTGVPTWAAFGLAASLTTLSTTALAQDAGSAAARSVYAPPAASSDVYRPAPSQPYAPTFTYYEGSSSRIPAPAGSQQPVVYEREEGFDDKKNRLIFFGFASLIVIAMTAGILYVIHTHKDEETPKKG